MKRKFIVISCIVFFLVAIVWYYNVNPETFAYSPRCVWKLVTGTQCPACGVQRALYSFLHGDFLKALSYNYFFIISIPFLLFAIFAECFKCEDCHWAHRIYNAIHNRFVLWTYVVLFFLWWIIRNILNI